MQSLFGRETPTKASMDSSFEQIHIKTGSGKLGSGNSRNNMDGSDFYSETSMKSVVKIPNFMLATMGRKMMVYVVIAVLLCLVGAACSVASVVSKTWFVVDVTGYNSFYGVFDATYNCIVKQGVKSCQSGKYTCVNSSICTPFSAFQVISVMAATLSCVSGPFLLYISTSIWNGTYTTASTRTIKQITYAVLILSCLLQLSTIISFIQFSKQANTGVAIPGVSGFFINNQAQVLAFAETVGSQANIPNNAFGRFGAAFYLMVSGAVGSFVSMLVLQFVGYRLHWKLV
ncbi:hypothetical protein BDR26DRAFT_871113 [Obelidium mucronatum]|nr:hypothetical protein BDR26DRAFT_871113 [Obelidium mucronatum]